MAQNKKKKKNKSVEEIVDTAKKIHKVAKNVRKGVEIAKKSAGVVGMAYDLFKGGKPPLLKLISRIINDPKWWKDGKGIPMLPKNENRPMDPKNYQDITDILTAGSVPHVSSVAVAMEDFSKSPWFLEATQLLYQKLRKHLRSNLIYTLDEVRAFLLASFSWYVEAVTMSRNLNWYGYVNPEMPEFWETFSSVTSGPTEQGLVPTLPKPSCLEEEMAKSLNAWISLGNIASQISIPQDVQDFVQYLFGRIYVDDALPNLQVYYFEPRLITEYLVDQDGNLVTQVSDIAASVTVDDLIENGQRILDKYGILMADLSKVGGIVPAQVLIDPEYHDYTFMHDTEILNMIMNGYTCDPSDYDEETESKQKGIFRVDFVKSILNTDHETGSYVGLTAMAVPGASPFRFLSQTIMLPQDAGKLPASIIGFLTSNKLAYKEYNGGWAIQLSTIVNSAVTLETNTQYLTSTFDCGIEAPFSAYSVGDQSSSAFSGKVVIPANVLAYGTNAMSRRVIGNSIEFRFPILLTNSDHTAMYSGLYNMWSDNVIAAVFIQLTGTRDPRSGSIDITGAKLCSKVGTTEVLDIATLTDVQLDIYGTYAAVVCREAHQFQLDAASFAGSSLDGIEDSIYILVTDLVDGVAAMAGANIEAAVAITANASAYGVATSNLEEIVAFFTNNLDYHIPIIMRRVTQAVITDGNSGAGRQVYTITGAPVLMKATYAPTIVHANDLYWVLYRMFYNLFSGYNDIAKE